MSLDIIDQRSSPLTEAELKTLPHGIVRVDRAGTILYYDGNTAALARGAPSKVGLGFFRDVPPCEPVRDLQGRFERFAAKPGSGIEQYPFAFHYPFGLRGVTFTMIRRSGDEQRLYVVVTTMAMAVS